MLTNFATTTTKNLKRKTNRNTGDLIAELFIAIYSRCIRFFSRRLFKHKLKMPYSSTSYEENKEEVVYIAFSTFFIHCTTRILKF